MAKSLELETYVIYSVCSKVPRSLSCVLTSPPEGPVVVVASDLANDFFYFQKNAICSLKIGIAYTTVAVARRPFASCWAPDRLDPPADHSN